MTIKNNIYYLICTLLYIIVLFPSRQCLAFNKSLFNADKTIDRLSRSIESLKVRRADKNQIKCITEYDVLINEACRLYGMEPSLIRAVIQVESNWNPRAVSKKGAKGLMQLMPDTAKEMGVKNIFNPRQNILGGTRYLALLLKRWKNNKQLTLAAYNAGSTSVEAYGGVPPFIETRDFVIKVLMWNSTFSNKDT